MTMREFYEAVINEVEAVELREFARLQIEKLDERNRHRAETLTATQKENLVLVEKITDFLTDREERVPAREIAEALEISTNKVASLCKKVENITIEPIKVDKRKVNGYKIGD